jgi:endonuclease YncB( thermonuclease family)
MATVFVSYQVPHLLGVVDYSKSKTLKPDGDTIHLFDPMLLVHGQVVQPRNDMFFVWVTGATKPKVIEIKTSGGRPYVTVRLAGLDAPEEHYKASPFTSKVKGKVVKHELVGKGANDDHSQPMWKPATDFLVNKLQTAGHAIVLLDREVTDHYGRALGYVYASSPTGEKSDFITLDLLKQGLAFPFVFESAGDLINDFLGAGAAAKKAGLGVWKNYADKPLSIKSIYPAPKHWDDPESPKQQAGKLNLPVVFRRVIDSHQLSNLSLPVALQKYDAMNYRTGDTLPGDKYHEIPTEDLIWAPHKFV